MNVILLRIEQVREKRPISLVVLDIRNGSGHSWRTNRRRPRNCPSNREAALAASADAHETYLRRGFGPALAKFIVLVSYEGPIPAGYADQPAPDPAAFGLPTEDDGSRNDPLAGQNIVSSTHYRHDFDALRAASTRIVIGVGATSSTILAGRAAIAVAGRLGTSPVVFPGGHDGFLGAEHGGSGDPDAFAATLRDVLAGSAGGGSLVTSRSGTSAIAGDPGVIASDR